MTRDKMNVITPQQFFGYRDGVEYLKETHNIDTYYEKFIYDVKEGRIVPRYLSERFPVLSREQLDDYAKNGETKLTVPEGLVGTDAAAELAGIGVSNFKRMVYSGQIPTHSIGGKLAFNVSDMIALKEKRNRQSV